MDKFDLIVIGSGARTHVASQAVKMGWNVALWWIGVLQVEHA